MAPVRCRCERVSARRRSAGAVVAAVIAVLIATALLGGCTNRESSDAYEERIAKIYTLRTATISGLASASQTDVDQYAEAQRKISQAAEQLEAVDPPRDVQQAHDRYVEALYGLSKLLANLADCGRAESGGDDAARACRRKLSGERIDEVRNDFAEADTIYRHEGYKLPSS